MFYEMAKRYDEWPGADYPGSSARGAMKGWHKFGVCGETEWPYVFNKADPDATPQRLADARRRPLGAYFRVNHKDLVAMHAAITETGILYATGGVHGGWDKVKADGIIPYEKGNLGGHAFALVGYDAKGFWLQNSWGGGWGRQGFGHLSYEDWLENGSDVWVARLGVPVDLDSARAIASGTMAATRTGQAIISHADLRPHVISLGNNGQPRTTGDFANSAEEIRAIVGDQFPAITAGWKKKRVFLYAHGGLVGEDAAVQRVAEYRAAMLPSEVYPLAFVWHSDFWSTMKNILGEALGCRRSEGAIDKAKDFLLDRLDDTLEPIARRLGGKAQWAEMKENALAATTSEGGGAALVLDCLKALVKKDPDIEIHVAGHSAGSIFMAPVIRGLAKFTPIKTCHLWAPACTMEAFRNFYLPALSGAAPRIQDFALYTLTDQAEQDDHCARIYNKSLLYLVSRALEEECKPIGWTRKGAPLLGMEKFIRGEASLMALFKAKAATWVLSPNHEAKPAAAAGSNSHGGFDDDMATLRGTLLRILGGSQKAGTFEFTRSASSRRDRRQDLQIAKP